ncbi:L-glyceraldehyde 3-phosphate reductase [Candidatus Poribacteria bacterium]|nr:L-glyceraldehyde 3-phosphate reductase [Candidatus Poribacteria bacterium]
MRSFAPDRYEPMSYRRCGASGLHLPAVSLGLWQSLGEAGNDDVCREVMFTAFDHGVTHFDLANNYGPPPGNSETVAGRILKEMPRDELIISSKAGYRMWPGPYGDFGSKKYLVASLDQSLKRLQLDYVDIFYHHRPDPGTPLDETMGALDLVVKQGKALYAGVSNYSGTQFRNAVETIQRHDWSPLTIHQPYYNMLGRGVESDLLPHTAAAGTGVIPFCPLAQGVLTDRYLDGLPADSRQGRRGESGQRWYAEQEAAGVWDRVRSLREIARERGQTVAQMAITWQLRDDRITSVLIGASSSAQIVENVAAATAPRLTDEELRRIDAVLRQGR